jgi:tRNA dimethylallyltransferase
VDLLRGRCTEAEARTRTVAATRRLVRRQESWFGADPDVVWVDAGEPGTVGRVRDVVRSRMLL